MRLKSLVILIGISSLVMTIALPGTASARLDRRTYAPIVIDKAKGYLYFNARVKKPEHPSGNDPTKFSAPNAIINEGSGSATIAAAMLAQNLVTADKLTAAMQDLGMIPGKNIAKGEQGKIAEGSNVKVTIKIRGKRVPLESLVKAGNPAANVNFLFLGNNEVQKQMGCGCLICGRSGPGTVIANSAYGTSDPAVIGPTLYAGLKKYGARDGRFYTITIRKR